MDMRLIWFWVVLVLASGCYGCLDQERNALLQLKAFFNHSNDDSLPSWVEDLVGGGSTNCCEWERVKCSYTTGRVIQLSLDHTRKWESNMTYWYLNASMFLPFEELMSLDLSNNFLLGCIENQEFDALNNLVELDMSWNRLDSIIYKPGLDRLSHLEELYLDATSISQTFLGGMTSLKVLSLRDSENNGSLSIQGLDGLSHLEELYLEGRSIGQTFLHNVREMTSLKVLSLRSSGLNGSLPNQGWCELFNLQELDLSGNDLKGTLPPCLGNLTLLRFLALSSNHFTGNIASSPLSSLTSLEYLILSHNHFEIPKSFASFFNHSRLKVIVSNNNRIIDQIEFQTGIPRFQLQAFSLSNRASNKVVGNPPSFLYSQHDLRLVDLSHLGLVGKFPSWLLENNTRLEYLFLNNNSFTGPFLLPSHPNPHFRSIDISHNKIQGQIPKNIGLIVPNLEDLSMSRNVLEGDIPTSLSDLDSLVMLDLSNNNLSGHLGFGSSSLVYLKLSHNNLHGQIFPTHVNLTNLLSLYLDNNHFVGKIPDSLSTLPLGILDISNNHMSGQIPRWMGNMSLTEIAMFKNHFDGPIPTEFCKIDSLVFLDLSENNISGSIPSCFNSTQIRHVYLNRNRLSGQMTRAFYNSSYLVTLDLSYNNLTGSIPSWFQSLSTLSILLLKSNHLQGKIPIELCHLKTLAILDLSQNNLSGSIPPCLGDITFNAINDYSVLLDFYGEVTESPNLFLSDVTKSKLYQPGNGLFSDEEEPDSYPLMDVQQEVEFTTKSRSYAYRGDILNYMTGIDLSGNKLTGPIPNAIGALSNIHALNLSHNNLSGSIPTTFSNLSQIESLDLSHNNLSGRIPPQLIELNYLAVFSVAYNNLLGKTPDQKAQFATFGESSYEGNPLLCGPPLHDNCTKFESPLTMPEALNGAVEDGFIDMGAFYVTFVVSYVIMLLGVAIVLYINPHWQRAWFHLCEFCGRSCYYFVLDIFF